MTRLALLTAAVLLSGCRFFNDPKEPSEAVLHRPTVSSGLPANAASLTADQWLQQSLAFYNQGRYLESIAAAHTALFLKPDLAEAYNNIGVAYAELHLWDFAIQAETQALLLQPRFELAKNNLAWARSQKQLEVR